MPIYTKTGDKGKTGLFSGIRVSKASPRIEAIGMVDELNSVIGLTISITTNREIKKELIGIQKDLFVIGGALANPLQKVKLLERVKEFENKIDEMTKKLPPLFNFILPGGGKSGSALHLARTVARRAERRMVELSRKEKVPGDLIIYINRLSDLFLTMSRFVNHKEKKKETIWRGEKNG
ncbi:cob(I)yrinic acid a,c-diamide adenosyltransferase [Patescibacteria group bacterium]|nr:cob(I)yrinic acid a,c-diamide adenosyltransferase [Patescibacteria group bacterium]